MHRRIALVVDDEEGVRKTVKGFLETMGVYVLEAEDAPTATKLAKGSPLKLDLLISDVLLPYVNGRDLANRISLSRPDIKVLFISGYPLDVLQSHGLCPSHVDLLLKPFSPAELEAKVVDIIRNGMPWRTRMLSGDGTLAV
jgi:DNA-binding response OmpR family regulator